VRTATAQFYRDAKRRLTLGGVLVANISGALEERASHFSSLLHGVVLQNVAAAAQDPMERGDDRRLRDVYGR